MLRVIHFEKALHLFVPWTRNFYHARKGCWLVQRVYMCTHALPIRIVEKIENGRHGADEYFQTLAASAGNSTTIDTFQFVLVKNT